MCELTQISKFSTPAKITTTRYANHKIGQRHFSRVIWVVRIQNFYRYYALRAKTCFQSKQRFRILVCIPFTNFWTRWRITALNSSVSYCSQFSLPPRTRSIDISKFAFGIVTIDSGDGKYRGPIAIDPWNPASSNGSGESAAVRQQQLLLLLLLLHVSELVHLELVDFIHQYDGFISLSFHWIGFPIPTVSRLQDTATHDNIPRQCTYQTSEAACWSCIQAANLQQASKRENLSADRHILAG